MARYLYSELSSMITARKNCLKSFQSTGVDNGWFDKHSQNIESLVKKHMPSGSGYDTGTRVDLDASHGEKLVFTTAFHHMDDWGGYDGWTDHTITVTPSLAYDFNLRISGRNRNDIKDMMYEDFRHALMTDVEWDIMREWPRVKDLGLEIKTVLVGEIHGVWNNVVMRGGELLFDGNKEQEKRTHGYKSAIELCKAFCVKYANDNRL